MMRSKAVSKAGARLREFVVQQAGKDQDLSPDAREALLIGFDLLIGLAENMAVLAESAQSKT